MIGAALMSIALLITSLTPAERVEFLHQLTPREALVFQHTWKYWARPKQLPPTDKDWSTWLVLAGRGFGKTRVGAEQMHEWAKEVGDVGRFALVGKDPADVRKTMIEGESGLQACAEPWFRPTYEPSLLELTWPNGCRAFAYSSETPDKLRGPQHHKFWGDELGKWKHPQDTWDNLQLGLRLGDNPQGVITTTPRPIPTLREILADPSTAVTRGSTYDNAANLPQKFLDVLLRKYEGTRLGRQELRAELLSDTPGALWTLAIIQKARVAYGVKVPHLVRICIAIDPATSDPHKVRPGGKSEAEEAEGHAETGIVVGGVDAEGTPYILEDASGHYSPGEWGDKAVELYHTYQADCVIAEVNQGGAMVEHVVKVAARDKRTTVPVRTVHATRGKQTRAEPVSSLYEQKRVRHVGAFPELEDQMTTWVPGMKSPDRMDALVWLVTALAIDMAPLMPPGVMDVGAGVSTKMPKGKVL